MDAPVLPVSDLLTASLETRQAELVTSNKGHLKLLHKDYQYTKQKVAASGNVRWVCTERKTKACKGSATTDSTMYNVLSSTDHNHAPDIGKIQAQKCRNAMKTRALTSQDSPSVIFEEEVRLLTEEGQLPIMSGDSAKRFIRHNRSLHLPKEPESVHDLQLDGQWTTTGGTNPETFLIYDYTCALNSRCIIFASERCLRFLGEARLWYMDGNSALVPKHFIQIYVIHAAVGNIVIPVAYALMTTKSKESYIEVFQAIVNHCEETNISLDPLEVVTDFDNSVMEAFHEVIGDHVVFRFSFFHLCQSTRQLVQHFNVVSDYRDNPQVRLFIGMLDGLAFLPEEKVVEGMNYLKTVMPEVLKDLVEYFESTYVCGTYVSVPGLQIDPEPDGAPPHRLQLQAPSFPPELWNAHDATLGQSARGINVSEAWNNQLSKMLGGHRPTIWKLIQLLQTDTTSAGASILHFELGLPGEERNTKNHLLCQKRLESLCWAYRDDRISMEKFLKGVSRAIKF